MMSYRSSEILIRSLLIMASSVVRLIQGVRFLLPSVRSAAATGQRHGAHAEQGLDFGDNNFRWHRHASADTRAGVHTFTVRDGGSNFLCHPSGHVKFRDDNVLGVFRGFTDFLPWPGPQDLDLNQTATDAFVLEESDGFTTLRHRCT